ncbi:hypothetical protein SDC9_78801 [bioreactor metagenome]|uniref:Antitoxin n=1 Tax=bioreactor metagenome TaxID=1076179 RepID=A0A644YV75_9ZZZZ
MNTKLTLNLDDNIIKEAKSYAKENQISLSKLIENYLSSLTKQTDKTTSPISPLVESLTGVISSDISDEHKSYGDYLTKKYA